jgi:myo-inositol 2-dehydrogenase/D-chiro-inositol 1-dehydrogenase
MKGKVRVALIGAGRIGRLHAENLVHRVSESELAAVSDVSAEAAENCARDYGIPRAETDYRTLLSDRDIWAVVICSSTNTHARIISDAAAAGKHIFCEKPIDLDLEVIDGALEAVRKAGVKLQIGFNRRFDPNHLKMRELVQSGKIGDPHILRITSRDPSPPPMDYVKVSGGLFLDMMIHDFDLARYVTGSEVEEVYTMAAVRVDPEIGRLGDVDTAVVSLKFENGILGTIDNSRKAVYHYDQRIEIFGSKGMAQTANKTPDTVSISGTEAVCSELPYLFFLERYAEAFVTEMREFVSCLREDREPSASGTDGKIAVKIGKAARLSYDIHRPVKVEEIT